MRAYLPGCAFCCFSRLVKFLTGRQHAFLMKTIGSAFRAPMVFLRCGTGRNAAADTGKQRKFVNHQIRKELEMKAESILEFDQIRKQWKEFACTKSAQEKIDSFTYYLSEKELGKNLRDTTDARNFMNACGMPPLASVEEAKECMARAARDGCLMPEQLERIEQLLTVVQRLKDYLDRGRTSENPLAWYGQNLDAQKELREELSDKIRGGRVDDYATKKLQQIRNEAVRTKEKMKQKAEQAMRTQKSYLADQFYTMRNGHICIPVKREYRQKVKGSVIDQSATGTTLFIEPAAVVGLQESLQMLELEEEQEISCILYMLTALVAGQMPVLEENIRMIEKLDFIFSKGKLSAQMDAAAPQINLDRRIRLKNARHPFIPKEQCVPLQFEIGGDVNGIIITGPNTGGKTVAMKTVALNCYLAQCGLHVTCEEADICMNSSFLCDIGDGQNLTQNLSTFSAHMKNVMEIIEQAGPESLVILDEPGSGTDPTEGMGIAVAVLEELRSCGCLFLATTHYPKVREYAERMDTIQNARMEFDRQTLQPLYRMVIGEAGESCAFYIAQRLGMPQRMLNMARQAAYGMEYTDRFRIEDKENSLSGHEQWEKRKTPAAKIRKAKRTAVPAGLIEKFHIGDSVMVLPDKKIGIVCQPVNEKGVLRVQLPDKKIWINHKRVRLHVPASELYPQDYDFSIIFDTVSDRKIRHDMERKYTEQTIEADT